MALDIADFDLTHTSREGAERVYATFNTVVNTSGVRTFKRNGKDKISFRAACLEDDCTMNRIFYSAAVIAESVYSFSGVPVPYGHPEDDMGRFLSALWDPDGRVFGNIGGSYENVDRVRNSGDGNDPAKSRIWGDVVLDVATLKSTKHGRAVLAMVQAEEPIPMSIGGYLDVIQTPSDPDKDYDALWFYADHFAIVPPDETPASTTDEGTGGFVRNCDFVSNRTREAVTLQSFTCNMAQDGSALDASGEKEAGDLLTGTNAGSTPASQNGWNEFVDTIANWCKTQKGGNDAAVNTEASDMADENQTNDGPETAANAEAGTVTNSGSASGAAFTPEQETRIAEIVTNAVSEVAKPLIDAQTATNADAEAKATAHKAELVEKVVANNTLTAEVAEATPVETLEALVANSSDASGSAPVNGTGESANTAPSADSVANTLNGTKEAA